jgi:hypothetical protein
MSTTRYRSVFYTPKKPSQLATCKALAPLLKQIGAEKCDVVERARKPFSAETLCRCYADELNAFVTGNEAGFVGFFSDWGETLSGWRFAFDVEGDPARWCTWVEKLAVKLPPYFAYLCPQDDYDTRHMSLPGAKGVSVAEFREYLPGLYWMTVFGKDLTAGIGKKAFDQLSDCEVKSLKGGLTSVRFEGPAVLAGYEPRIATLQKQATRLKPNLFFDPKKSSGYQQIPELLSALGH